MGKADVKAMEQELTEIVNNNRNDPRIYEKIKTLAWIFVRQNGYTKGYFGVEDVVHDVAADLTIKVRDGREIKKWISYIGICIKLSYVKNQRQLEHEYIDTTDNPKLQNGVINMCAGASRSAMNDMIKMQQNLFLGNIDAVIRETMQHTKFKYGTKDWLTVYTNVCISLAKGKITYFRIEDRLKPYIPLVINQFKTEFYNSSFMERVFGDGDNNYTLDLAYEDSNEKDYSQYYKNNG